MSFYDENWLPSKDVDVTVQLIYFPSFQLPDKTATNLPIMCMLNMVWSGLKSVSVKRTYPTPVSGLTDTCFTLKFKLKDK